MREETKDPFSSLLRFAVGLTPRALPEESVKAARRCFIDFFAVALAGASEPLAKQFVRYVEEAKGDASVIGSSLRTSMEHAAFANGVLGHILDYDDVKSNLGHGTVVIAPAVLALGEKLGKPGREVLCAFIAGFEVAARIANGLEPSHSKSGWHTMATCGVFGAATACGKLLSFNEERLGGSLGIAASFSAGLRRNMGTPAKPLHAGQAAQSGLKAALLASLGFYGSRDLFSGPKCFANVFSSKYEEKALTRGLGDDFEIARDGFKLYPSCASTHSAVDAVIELKRNHDLKAEDIAEVYIGSVPIVIDNLPYHEPRTTSECRFSMPFCVAVALTDGDLHLENLTETRLRDPRITALMRKITLGLDPGMTDLGYRGTENASVRIKTHQGREFLRQVDAARGHPSNPLSEGDLREKFQRCAAYSGFGGKAEKMFSVLNRIEEVSDVGELFNV